MKKTPAPTRSAAPAPTKAAPKPSAPRTPVAATRAPAGAPNGRDAPKRPTDTKPQSSGGFVPNEAARDKMQPAVDRLLSKSRELGMDSKKFEEASKSFFDDPTPESWDRFHTEFDELQGIGPRSDAQRAEREREKKEALERSAATRDRDLAAAERLRDGRLTGEQFMDRLGGEKKVLGRFGQGDLGWKDVRDSFGDFGTALDRAQALGGTELHRELYRDMSADVAGDHIATRGLPEQIGQQKTAADAQRVLDRTVDERALDPNQRAQIAKDGARKMEERGRQTAAHELIEDTQRDARRADESKAVNQAAARIDPADERTFDAIRGTDTRQQELYDRVRDAEKLNAADVERMGTDYDAAQKRFLEQTLEGRDLGDSADARRVQDYLQRPGSALVDEALLRRAEHANRTGMQRGAPPDDRRVDAMLGRAAKNPAADLRDMQLGHPANPGLPAEMRKTRLGEHDLAGRDLSGSDLRNVRLTRTDLGGANLNGVDLTGAQLDRSNLSGVNLATTRGLAEADLRGAYYDRDTRFPAGFDPQHAGMIRALSPKDDFATQPSTRPSSSAPSSRPARSKPAARSRTRTSAARANR